MSRSGRTPAAVPCPVHGGIGIEIGQGRHIHRHRGRVGIVMWGCAKLESVRQQRGQPEKPGTVGRMIGVGGEIATPSARRMPSELLGLPAGQPSCENNRGDILRRDEDIPRQNRRRIYALHVHILPVRASQNSAWRHLTSALISSAREVKDEQPWMEFADAVSRYHDLENQSNLVNFLLP